MFLSKITTNLGEKYALTPYFGRKEVWQMIFFLTFIWVPHGQVCAIIEGTAPHTQC